MKKSDVPKDVVARIRDRAKDTWGDNTEMVKDAVRAEIDAFVTLHNLNFGAAAEVKTEILQSATSIFDSMDGIFDSWEQRLSWVEDEIGAFLALKEMVADDIPEHVLQKLRDEAMARENEGDYASQLSYVNSGIEHHRYVVELTGKVAPIRELLLRMEQIIGNECYNAKMQNYGPWGVWEGEGRSFRYPVRFIRDGKTEKHWNVPEDIDPVSLMTGQYLVGQNEISIFRGLLKIVEMIENNYGIRLGKPK